VVALAKPALENAFALLERRFGAGALSSGATAAERRAARRFPFGVASLDALLDGGAVAGEPLAISATDSSGALTLALRAAASAQQRGGEIAWIDPSRSFDALSAMRAGIDLERFLVVRCAPAEIAFTARTLARASVFVLIVLDLGSRVSSTRSMDELSGSALAHLRAARGATLVLGGEREQRGAFSSVIRLRRVEWLRAAGRIVGWRSLVTPAHAVASASLSFLPLATPSTELIDGGLQPGEVRLEATA
jgi:hypothetical protein